MTSTALAASGAIGDGLNRLAEILASAARPIVLTGAGCSTESGIPDYRDADGAWKHRQPMTFQRFVGSQRARQRYWAGSLVGWRRIERARPNPGHAALAELERAGRLDWLITQNVDSLHRRAGSRRLTELHGRLDRVVCLGCRDSFSRRRFQSELERVNSHLATSSGSSDTTRRDAPAPDGDQPLAEEQAAQTSVPSCLDCGGILKPDVVFFGESIPRSRLMDARDRARRADALLVVGSSLMVPSGRRLVEAGAEAGAQLLAVNLGRTALDHLFELKLSAPCGVALPLLARYLR